MSFLPAARVGILEGLPVVGQVSMSNYTPVTLADGASDGNLITVDLASAVAVAYDALTGNIEALAGIINADAQAAEENTGEGDLVVLQMTGWEVPLLGSIGQRAADQINVAWTNGSIAMNPWPGNSQVAYFDASSDTVSIYWQKGQTLLLYAVLGVLIAISFLAIAGYVRGILAQWGLIKAAPVTTPPGGPPSPTPTGIAGWWAGLSPLGKGGVIVGAGALGAGTLIFMAERSIAQAGAARSTTEIVVGR